MIQDISASCAVEIEGNKITGRLRLQKFSIYLKWSKIGKLHMHLIQVNQNKSICFSACSYVFFLIQNWMKLNTIG